MRGAIVVSHNASEIGSGADIADVPQQEGRPSILHSRRSRRDLYSDAEIA
jgi:hypothetical protein